MRDREAVSYCQTILVVYPATFLDISAVYPPMAFTNASLPSAEGKLLKNLSSDLSQPGFARQWDYVPSNISCVNATSKTSSAYFSLSHKAFPIFPLPEQFNTHTNMPKKPATATKRSGSKAAAVTTRSGSKAAPKRSASKAKTPTPKAAAKTTPKATPKTKSPAAPKTEESGKKPVAKTETPKPRTSTKAVARNMSAAESRWKEGACLLWKFAYCFAIQAAIIYGMYYLMEQHAETIRVYAEKYLALFQ